MHNPRRSFIGDFRRQHFARLGIHHLDALATKSHRQSLRLSRNTHAAAFENEQKAVAPLDQWHCNEQILRQHMARRNRHARPAPMEETGRFDWDLNSGEQPLWLPTDVFLVYGLRWLQFAQRHRNLLAHGKHRSHKRPLSHFTIHAEVDVQIERLGIIRAWTAAEYPFRLPFW